MSGKRHSYLINNKRNIRNAVLEKQRLKKILILISGENLKKLLSIQTGLQCYQEESLDTKKHWCCIVSSSINLPKRQIIFKGVFCCNNPEKGFEVSEHSAQPSAADSELYFFLSNPPGHSKIKSKSHENRKNLIFSTFSDNFFEGAMQEFSRNF